MTRQLGLTFIICYGIDFIYKFLVRTDIRVIDIKQGIENLKDGISSIRCKLVFYFLLSLILMLNLIKNLEKFVILKKMKKMLKLKLILKI